MEIETIQKLVKIAFWVIIAIIVLIGLSIFVNFYWIMAEGIGLIRYLGNIF